MNMQEASRIILALRAAGWDDKSINDFILCVETGDERYKPTTKKEYKYFPAKAGFICVPVSIIFFQPFRPVDKYPLSLLAEGV